MAAWVIWKVRPATVNVPFRTDPVLFCATSYRVVPGPVPVGFALMVTHGTLDADVHAHPLVVVTVMVFPSARLREYDALVGEMLYVHGAAAWTTWKT